MKLPPARATIALTGVTALAFLAGPPLVGEAALPLIAGFIPARVSGLALPGALPFWLTPLSATLVHGGLFHVAMNLLMLGFCGRWVEPALAARGLVLLYVAGAYAAAAAQWLWSPLDMMPMVGASGAISAVLAAYALLYGERRVRVAHPGVARWLNIAWLAAGWIGINLLVGFATRATGLVIAIPAHIGGFLAGLLLTRPLLRWRFGRAGAGNGA